MRIDAPIANSLQDKFDFRPPAGSLAAEIVFAKETPFVVGMYGGWGSGKSSFMRLMLSSLNSRKTPTVWFDAWKYDRKEDVLYGLLQTISDELQNLDASAYKTIKIGMSKLLRGAGRLSLKVGGQIASRASMGVLPETVGDDVLGTFGEAEETHRYIESLEKEFATQINLFLEHYGKGKTLTSKVSLKLTIFLDDLDRCLPSSAMQVLEALKLDFNQARCVFVIGVDREMMHHTIAVHYGIDPNTVGRDYLDKIVTVPFLVPTIANQQLAKAYEGLIKTLKIGPALIDFISVAAGENPRRMLRIVNHLELLMRSAEVRGIDPFSGSRSLISIVVVACLQARWPGLIEIARWHYDDFLGFLTIMRGDPMGDIERILTMFQPYGDDVQLRLFAKCIGPAKLVPWTTPPDASMEQFVAM
jgi:hypothetical protein